MKKVILTGDRPFKETIFTDNRFSATMLSGAQLSQTDYFL